MRVRLFTRFFAVPVMTAAACAVSLAPALAATAGPPCGERTVSNEKGLSMRILFANNGSVQRYIVVGSHPNEEAVNDMLIVLQRAYGPAGLDSPPLRIISFKPGEGGMQIPDKAVDSCGRKLSFQQ